MKKSIYTVILGDLVKSRGIPERKKAARTIEAALTRVSSEVTLAGRGRKSLFVAEPKLIRGIDEMAAVLQQPVTAYRLCRQINFHIHPLRFRFVVVSGFLDVGVETGDAGKMDGPAFHDGAGELEKLKRQRKKYLFQLIGNEIFDPWLNATVNLTQAIMDEWTDHQMHIVRLADELPTQQAIATALGITPQAVSATLTAANWREVQTAFRLIDEHLRALSENQPGTGRRKSLHR